MADHENYRANYYANYLILKAYCIVNNSASHGYEKVASEWAIERARRLDSGEPPSIKLETVEKARRELLGYIRDVYTPGDKEEWTDDEAVDALLLLVQFDRANALYLMKIDRNDPKCPRGILWITKEEISKYAEVKWNGIPATNAITKKYRVYLTAHKIGNRRLHLESFTASATLDCLLWPFLPIWLRPTTPTQASYIGQPIPNFAQDNPT